jgi:hypothetical protein
VLERVAPNSGWRGRVLDAHDGEPIGFAQISILGPSFRSTSAQHSVTTAADGRFALPTIPAPWPEGTLMRVTGVYHATLEQPLPIEGEIAVYLTTRRRALLQRLAKWVERRGAPYEQLRDPTPGEVASTAASRSESDVIEWARDVEHAVYGPAPPTAGVEQTLIRREPGS